LQFWLRHQAAAASKLAIYFCTCSLLSGRVKWKALFETRRQFPVAHFEINYGFTRAAALNYEIACHDHAGNILICGTENVHVKVAFEVGRYSTQLKAHLWVFQFLITIY
jgi:hypothetical protein